LDNIERITGLRPGFEKLDLCDRDKTDLLFAGYPDISAVIHFAAFKSVGESVKEPLKYYRNNLLSTLNLLGSMASHGVKHIAFSSSCTVYGQPDVLPVTEQTPLKKAESPYGNTKKIMEDMIEDVTKDGKIKAISLRYFNPIGAHESALIGEAPSDIPDNLVPYLTQSAIGMRPFLKVFGDDYDTPDGTPVRDYLHVSDLARAHLLALERLADDKGKADYEVFNLGTGTGYSVMDVIKSFERSTGQKLNYRVVERRPGDIEKIWANPEYANEELGWKAEKSLDEMMLTAWNWEKARSK
jgi:UDP-glucose 4-epimerase